MTKLPPDLSGSQNLQVECCRGGGSLRVAEETSKEGREGSAGLPDLQSIGSAGFFILPVISLQSADRTASSFHCIYSLCKYSCLYSEASVSSHHTSFAKWGINI